MLLKKPFHKTKPHMNKSSPHAQQNLNLKIQYQCTWASCPWLHHSQIILSKPVVQQYFQKCHPYFIPQNRQEHAFVLHSPLEIPNRQDQAFDSTISNRNWLPNAFNNPHLPHPFTIIFIWNPTL